jgi:hypothetical protein
MKNDLCQRTLSLFFSAILRGAMLCYFFPGLKIQGSVEGADKVSAELPKGRLEAIRAAPLQYLTVCQDLLRRGSPTACPCREIAMLNVPEDHQWVDVSQFPGLRASCVQ